ncbi:MAG: hypothetical protein ABI895_05475 [Deltaproteobacteria bacterium]
MVCQSMLSGAGAQQECLRTAGFEAPYWESEARSVSASYPAGAVGVSFDATQQVCNGESTEQVVDVFPIDPYQVSQCTCRVNGFACNRTITTSLACL